MLIKRCDSSTDVYQDLTKYKVWWNFIPRYNYQGNLEKQSLTTSSVGDMHTNLITTSLCQDITEYDV